MQKVTYQDSLADPIGAHARIQRAARRAQVEAVRRYLFAPLARFCGRLVAVRGVKRRLDPRAPKPAA